MSGAVSRVLVIGGAGSLGRAVCSLLSSSGFVPISCDLTASPTARASIIVCPNLSPSGLATTLHAALSTAPPLAGIIVTAGAWEGGNAADAKFLEKYAKLDASCVTPALAGAALAAGGVLSPRGLFVCTGAAAVLPSNTPPTGMLAYALAKSTTHALIRVMGTKGGGLPGECRAIAIAPHTLDTVANRTAMPDADVSSWTKPEVLADKIIGWLRELGLGSPNADETVSKIPQSGSIVEVRTKGGKNEWIYQ